MKWFVFALPLILVFACTPGEASYQDRVRPLPPEQAHPLLKQLLPVLDQPEGRTSDELIQIWKEFLADAPLPLRDETGMTFVYYDFSHSLKDVYLEASFAPQRLERLTRMGTTPLFYRVYSVPKPSGLHYRFSTGTKALADPFHPTLESSDPLWHPLVDPTTGEPQVQWVTGASEPLLEGQDLRILLPPGYQRDLSQSYPLVVLVGLSGTAWTQPLDQLQRETSIRPVLVVSVGDPPSLKAVLEERVVPWMRAHYRAGATAADLVLVGWGPSAKTVQDLAASRPDFWTKTWTPLADQARGDQAWNTLAPPFFRTLFSVVAP